MLLRIIVALFALALALCACAAPPTRAPSAKPLLGEPFTLAVGQSATLADAPLTITFDTITEDSRCPKQVECIWAGRAVLAISARRGNDAPAQLSLSTLAVADKTDQVTFDGYTITLQQVQPYPETPDKPIKLDEYRATFVVRYS